MAREICRRQFEASRGMGEHLPFGYCADAAVAIAKGFEDAGVAGAWLEPEIRFQRRDRDNASDRAVLAYEAKLHAEAIGEHLRFKFGSFHRWQGQRFGPGQNDFCTCHANRRRRMAALITVEWVLTTLKSRSGQ